MPASAGPLSAKLLRRFLGVINAKSCPALPISNGRLVVIDCADDPIIPLAASSAHVGGLCPIARSQLRWRLVCLLDDLPRQQRLSDRADVSGGLRVSERRLGLHAPFGPWGLTDGAGTHDTGRRLRPIRSLERGSSFHSSSRLTAAITSSRLYTPQTWPRLGGYSPSRPALTFTEQCLISLRLPGG